VYRWCLVCKYRPILIDHSTINIKQKSAQGSRRFVRKQLKCSMNTRIIISPHLAQHDHQIQLSGSHDYLRRPACYEAFLLLAFLFFLFLTSCPSPTGSSFGSWLVGICSVYGGCAFDKTETFCRPKRVAGIALRPADARPFSSSPSALVRRGWRRRVALFHLLLYESMFVNISTPVTRRTRSRVRVVDVDDGLAAEQFD
jgi:hypothetical protein